MSKLHVSSTYASVTIMIAALAALAVALIAASPAHAVPCTTVGAATGTTGNDRMCGSTGGDVMLGLEGNDTMTGGNGNDTLDGSFGDDLVDGGSGNDSVRGGPGVDELVGGSGNDLLRFRDGELDVGMLALAGPSCGSGTDTLDLDLLDATAIVTSNFLLLGLPIKWGDCENITVGAVNEGPNVIISRRSVKVGQDGRAAVQLRCPATLSAPCAGKLAISGSKKKVGPPQAYTIDQGKKDDVSARLSRRDRRKLRRRGQISASAISVEAGQFGDKTTVETLKLIAQA